MMRRIKYFIVFLVLVPFLLNFELNAKDSRSVLDSLMNIIDFNSIESVEQFEIAIRAFELTKELKDKELEAELSIAISKFYNSRGEYSRAIYNLKHSEAIYIGLKSDEGIANINLILGDVYRGIFNFQKSIECLYISLNYYVKHNDHHYLSRVYNRLASTYFEMLERDSTLYYANKSIESISRIDSNHSLIGNNYNIIGMYYMDFDKKIAEEYFFKAIENYLANSVHIGLPNVYHNIALNFHKQNSINKALEYITLSYEFAKEYEINIYINISAGLKSTILYELGRYKEAYEYKEIHQKYRDDMFGRRSIVDIRNLEYQIEQEKYNAELSAQQQKQKYQRNILLIIISIILFAILILAFSRRILKHKNSELEAKNKLIEEQKENFSELNLTKDKFFSIIAHDLKGPLGAFKNMTELFESHFHSFTDEEKLEFVTDLKIASIRIYDLLVNLLIWSRSQMGIIQINPEYSEITPILKSTVSLLKPGADSKNIELLVEASDKLSCYVDPNILQLILRNIVSNAIKFSYPESKIIIKAESSLCRTHSTPITLFTVQDYGIGISQDDMGKLFRIDISHVATGTSGESGTGLGLTIVKEFVEKQGGEISLESEIGAGTIVQFSIPCHPPN